MTRPLLLAGAFLFIAAPLYAQSVGPATIDAAGSSFTGGGITYEFAIGQVAVDNSLISTSLVVTPGVLQPVISTTGISPNAISSAELRVFPDPVESTLFIQPVFEREGTIQLGLYDAAGKLVRRQGAKLNTGGELQTLDVSNLAAGQYMLQVIWISGGTSYASGYKLRKLQ